MLTVKLMNYGPKEPGLPPTLTQGVVIRPAKVIYISFDKHMRTELKFETPEGDMETVTIGEQGREDVMFNTAYIMNDAGRTVETIR